MLRAPSVALVRVLALSVAAASAVGLFVAAPVGLPTASAGIVATDSAVTIPWMGDSSTPAVTDLQPSRASVKPGHISDFKDLKITVSQTKGIRDQAIRIDFEGLAPTLPGTSASTDSDNAMNYMQFMQCWGDPRNDETFRNTCEWGGLAVTSPPNLRKMAPAENELRGPQSNGGTVFDNEAFLSAQGKSYPASEAVNESKQTYWPLGEAFDGASTNEIIAASVGTSGKGMVNFEALSATKAPQLGCGADTQHQRCYIVAIPRGTHFGGTSGLGECSLNTPAEINSKTVQEGSPLSRRCDYWKNRIVIPLDFDLTGNNCPSGSANQRTIGSQLIVGAMSSWQPSLCRATPNVYNLSTNPDGIARTQLLSAGAGLAFTSFAPEDDVLSSINAEKLKKTAISYSPVAVSGVTIAFLFEDTTGPRTTLNLTPRLVAKLLTESYAFQNPLSLGGEVVLSLPAFEYTDPTINPPVKSKGPYHYFTQDPDFRKANPEITRALNPALILPGPAGADAITQLWRWVQADAAARAWLDGAPDEYGMRINPYYLPLGDPAAQVPQIDSKGAAVKDASGAVQYRAVGLSNVDGSPLHLSTTTRDFFARADESAAPATLPDAPTKMTRFTSLQSSPFADTLLSAARAAARADPGSRTSWDPTKINAAGDAGDWVSPGPQLSGQKFAIAITDTASAEKYGLSEAALCPANVACVPFSPAVAGVNGTPGTPAITSTPTPTATPTPTPAPPPAAPTPEPTEGAESTPAPQPTDAGAPAAVEVTPAVPAVAEIPAKPEIASTFVSPTTASMTQALDSLIQTKSPYVLQVDPGSVAGTAYPLTTVVYAAVNLTLTSDAVRKAYGEMVTYAVTDGQRPGTDLGELPFGYVPLPKSLVQQALVSVQTMLGYVSPNASGAAPAAPLPAAQAAPANAASAPLQAAAAAAQTTVTSIPSTAAGTTASVETPALLQGLLGGSLIVGLVGAVFAPLLMRPRRPLG